VDRARLSHDRHGDIHIFFIGAAFLLTERNHLTKGETSCNPFKNV